MHNSQLTFPLKSIVWSTVTSNSDRRIVRREQNAFLRFAAQRSHLPNKPWEQQSLLEKIRTNWQNSDQKSVKTCLFASVAGIPLAFIFGPIVIPGLCLGFAMGLDPVIRALLNKKKEKGS